MKAVVPFSRTAGITVTVGARRGRPKPMNVTAVCGRVRLSLLLLLFGTVCPCAPRPLPSLTCVAACVPHAPLPPPTHTHTHTRFSQRGNWTDCSPLRETDAAFQQVVSVFCAGPEDGPNLQVDSQAYSPQAGAKDLLSLELDRDEVGLRFV